MEVVMDNSSRPSSRALRPASGRVLSTPFGLRRRGRLTPYPRLRSYRWSAGRSRWGRRLS